jgi:hypothetical protein
MTTTLQGSGGSRRDLALIDKLDREHAKLGRQITTIHRICMIDRMVAGLQILTFLSIMSRSGSGF